jgi:glycosyltransferase involved in cell wall biosynthesis
MTNAKSKVNIVYIAASEFPSNAANSVQVIKQCNAFASIGANVLLLARERSCDFLGVDSVRDQYGISEKVFIKLMHVYNFAPKFIFSLWYPFWLAFHTSDKAHIVYGRHLLGLLVCALFTSRNVPIIFESHGPPQWFESLGLRSLWLLGRLTKIVVISNSLKDILRRRYTYLRRINIVVAHDGCDPTDKLSRPISILRAGYVGSFYRGRGLELLHEVAKICPDIEFHLVGGDEAAYETIVGEVPLANIRCHGRVAPVELGNYYKLFNVALAPYARKVEVADGTNTVDYMSPLKIFEYMGYGKTIIASNLPVLKEILIDGENALLAEPDNPLHWAAMLRILRDQNLRKRLSEKAQFDAITHYTWHARAKLVLNFDD